MNRLEYMEKARIRRKRIVKLYDNKKLTFQEIASIFGISRQRAYQLYKQEVENG